jgi:hypothetical protein
VPDNWRKVLPDAHASPPSTTERPANAAGCE